MKNCRQIFRLRLSAVISLGLIFLNGCVTNGKFFTSKWAADDPTYAETYSAPYSSNTLRKWSRMGQQMVDARFEADKSGVYVSAGAAEKHRAALGGEIGVFHLPNSWSTVKFGAVGLLAEGLPSYLTGAVVGGRIHTPTRLAPYIGLSGMAGYSQETSKAETTYVDSSGQVIQAGQTVNGPSATLAAIIPEAGVSYWINSCVRFNLGISGYVTTAGRDHDFLWTGMSLELIPWEFARDNDPEARVHTAPPELNRLLDSKSYFHAQDERAAYEDSIHIYDGGRLRPANATAEASQQGTGRSPDHEEWDSEPVENDSGE